MKRDRITFWLLALTVTACLGAGCSKPTNATVAQTGTENAAAAPAPFSGAKSSGGNTSEPGFATRSKPAATLIPENVVIPAGTAVAVRLQQSITSQTATGGQRFEAVLDDPIVVNGQNIAQRGANATGHVVSARSSGRLHNSGYLRIALDAVSVNGKMVPVQSSSVYIQGASHKKRNLAWIGGTTAGGALLGGIFGGGKGALIGGAAGAGAGTTAAYATGKRDVGFGAERRVTFRITQNAQVS